jgi:hypothetical protein
MEVCYILVYEDKIMESTKHLEKGGKKSEEE